MIALVLARSRAASKRSSVMTLLSAVSLALLGQRFYVYARADLLSVLAYGFWVVLVGAIVVTWGAYWSFWAITRSNCRQLTGCISAHRPDIRRLHATCLYKKHILTEVLSYHLFSYRRCAMIDGKGPSRPVSRVL